jgi:hypothetical protein
MGRCEKEETSVGHQASIVLLDGVRIHNFAAWHGPVLLHAPGSRHGNATNARGFAKLDLFVTCLHGVF